MVETASPVGQKTSTISDQMVENKNDYKLKVVLLKLDLGMVTKMVINRASHENSDNATALVFKFLEQDAWEYIDQMVQEPLQEH